MFWHQRYRRNLAELVRLKPPKHLVFTGKKRDLRLQSVSRASEDGIRLALFDRESGETLAEVFRSDSDHTLTFRGSDKMDLPFSLAAQMIEVARERLEPFEDGTPLSEAKNNFRVE